MMKILEWCFPDQVDSKISLTEQIATALEDCETRLRRVKSMMKNSLQALSTECLSKLHLVLDEEIVTLNLSEDINWASALKPPQFAIEGKKITKMTSSGQERFALLDCNLSKCTCLLMQTPKK